jgi:hypothetical protein
MEVLDGGNAAWDVEEIVLLCQSFTNGIWKTDMEEVDIMDWRIMFKGP